MKTFSDMVTQSVLARFMSIILLSAVFLCALIIGTYDLVIGREIPSVITTIIGVGIGTAGAFVGINFGVILSPAPSPVATSQTTTLKES